MTRLLNRGGLPEAGLGKNSIEIMGKLVQKNMVFKIRRHGYIRYIPSFWTNLINKRSFPDWDFEFLEQK